MWTANDGHVGEAQVIEGDWKSHVIQPFEGPQLCQMISVDHVKYQISVPQKIPPEEDLLDRGATGPRVGVGLNKRFETLPSKSSKLCPRIS